MLIPLAVIVGVVGAGFAAFEFLGLGHGPAKAKAPPPAPSTTPQTGFTTHTQTLREDTARTAAVVTNAKLASDAGASAQAAAKGIDTGDVVKGIAAAVPVAIAVAKGVVAVAGAAEGTAAAVEGASAGGEAATAGTATAVGAVTASTVAGYASAIVAVAIFATLAIGNAIRDVQWVQLALAMGQQGLRMRLMEWGGKIFGALTDQGVSRAEAATIALSATLSMNECLTYGVHFIPFGTAWTTWPEHLKFWADRAMYLTDDSLQNFGADFRALAPGFAGQVHIEDVEFAAVPQAQLDYAAGLGKDLGRVLFCYMYAKKFLILDWQLDWLKSSVAGAFTLAGMQPDFSSWLGPEGAMSLVHWGVPGVVGFSGPGLAGCWPFTICGDLQIDWVKSDSSTLSVFPRAGAPPPPVAQPAPPPSVPSTSKAAAKKPVVVASKTITLARK